jgi:predicted CXXCH cytochrome family protein
MARKRIQKTIAARIDRSYIDHLERWRKFRRGMVFLVTVLAILLGAFATFGDHSELVHNPGRLCFVHAKFQNDCAQCHDGCDANGKPTGKFSKAVSDNACLKCHDAGIHHPNQATMVVSDVNAHPPHTRSADCAVCHVEHRGQAALVSTSDELCLVCHADLSGKTIHPLPADVPNQVTAFDLTGHPHFGRSLMKDGKLFDPTALRFNHKKHLGILKGEQQDCIWCHNPDPYAGTNLKWETGKTAYAMPGGNVATESVPRPLDDATGRHRSLTQVNYDRNCKSCHDLGTLPNSDVAIPHAEMAQVRQVILAYVTSSIRPWQKYAADRPGAREKPLNDRFISKLNVPSDYTDAMDAVTKAVKTDPLSAAINQTDPLAKLPPDLVAKLTAAAGKFPTNVVPAAEKAKVLAALSATTAPAYRLRGLVIDRLRVEAAKGLSGEAKAKTLRAFDEAFARYNQDTPDPRLLEVFVAYANDAGVSCVKCHDTEGSPAAVPPEWSALASQAKPIEESSVFHTQPTGIPAGPRRWYVNSEFNHDAHRSMNCVECHAAALTSEKTGDVLSPDIQWQGLKFDPPGSDQMVAATRSCFECHHPDNSEGPGAASNCTECHIYHDRSHEAAPKPTPADVLNGKVASAPKQIAAAGP